MKDQEHETRVDRRQPQARRPGATTAGPNELTPAFTPGPWRVDPDWREGGADQVVRDGDYGRTLTVAFIATSLDDDTEEEHHATAHLITAAPELYTLALQYRNDLRHGVSADSKVRRLAAIDAALAKAEGR